MYAKIFAQIFDSSIAENYEVRHVFEDLLKLSDQHGIVDMTEEAIARRANCPLKKIQFGIRELLKPDPRSRSREEEGRRLIPLNSGRCWGWQIVNYEHYRGLQNEEARRAYNRDAKRRERARKARSFGKPLPGEVVEVAKYGAGEASACDVGVEI
ncbi:MAG: hypothetical protein AAB883_01825 [Patescibacteria group bacterium]